MAAAIGRIAAMALPAIMGAFKSGTAQRALSTAAKWGRRIGGFATKARQIGGGISSALGKGAFTRQWARVSPHLDRIGRYSTAVGQGAELGSGYKPEHFKVGSDHTAEAKAYRDKYVKWNRRWQSDDPWRQNKQGEWYEEPKKKSQRHLSQARFVGRGTPAPTEPAPLPPVERRGGLTFEEHQRNLRGWGRRAPSNWHGMG